MKPKYDKHNKKNILDRSLLKPIPRNNIKVEEGPDTSMHIDVIYEQAVGEMSFQQTKRDQLVSFYFTAIAAIIAFVTGVGGAADKKIYVAVFLLLTLVGIAFTFCVIRYRTYKEAYMLQCRVITQLHNLAPNCLNKENIQKLYAHAMSRNYYRAVVEKERDTGDVDHFACWRGQLRSAETMMFEVMLICTCAAATLTMHYLGLGGSTFENILMFVPAALIFAGFNYLYTNEVIKVYRYVTILHHAKHTESLEEKSDLGKDADGAFNFAFSKAWMLHCYLDDEKDIE